MDNATVAQAREFLQKAIKRHGGDANFRSIEAITIRIKESSGLMPLAKGSGRTFTMAERVVVCPNADTATFHYPSGAVRYDKGAIETDTERIENYRETFAGFRKLRFWDNKDSAYFFGYALVNYFRLPFALAALPIRTASITSGSTSWIETEFPVDVDTHSKIQRFWFDESGLLFRHDYRADILGPIFYGAHFSHDYRFDLAIPIAETRVVNVRMGSIATPIPVLKAKFSVESIE